MSQTFIIKYPDAELFTCSLPYMFFMLKQILRQPSVHLIRWVQRFVPAVTCTYAQTTPFELIF